MDENSSSPEILCPIDILQNLDKFLGKRELHKVSKFDGPYSRRSVTELIILLQSIRLGGYKKEPKLIPLLPSSNSRTNLILKQHNYLMRCGTAWFSDITALKEKESLLITSSFVQPNEYEVGLYTRPEHPIPEKITPEYLSSLSAVTNLNWSQDIQVLESLNLKKIHLSHSHELMLKMVSAGRVDFMLSSFKNNKDMLYFDGKYTLTPIPYVKVKFPSSRHWNLRKEHKDALIIHTSIETGLSILRKNGTINQAILASGFRSKKTKDWKVLNPLHTRKSLPKKFKKSKYRPM